MSRKKKRPPPPAPAAPVPAPPPRSILERSLPALIASFIIALIAFVFAQTRVFEFVNFDDNVNVYDNYQVLHAFTWDTVVWAFSLRSRDYWHPLTMITHALDYYVFGANAGGHHVMNVVWHALAALALLWALVKLTGRLWLSAIVAALFAIHPLRAESVAWISERKDVLSGIFFSLTLAAYANYVRQRSALRYLLVAVLFLMGLASKPTLMPLPFLLLVLDFWPFQRFRESVLTPQGRRDALRLFVEKIPLMLLSAFSLLEAASGAKDAFELNRTLAWKFNAGNAIVSYSTYLWQTFYPLNLSPIYPHPAEALRWGDVWLSAALLAAISGIAWVQRARRPALLVGWLWYLGMLAPMIGFVQAGLIAHADRYTYIPQIGVLIAVVWLASDLETLLPRARVLVRASALAAIATLAILCRAQTAIWINSETLWSHAIAVTKDNYMAYCNLGYTRSKAGKNEQAIADYSTGVKIKPDYPQFYNGRALAYTSLERHELAMLDFTTALRFKPDSAPLYSNRGHSFNRMGEYKAALDDYAKALEIERNNPGSLSIQNIVEIFSNRIYCLMMLRDFPAAWAEVARTERLKIPLQPGLKEELTRRSPRPLR